MARQVRRSKAIDKWKLKKKYEVIAPDIFGNVSVGYIFSREEASLIGRTIETTMSKLTDSNQHHIKVGLRVIGTKGFTALTEVYEVALSRAYISSHTTQGVDIVEDIFDLETQDKKRIRVKVLIFTRQKIHNSQKRLLRQMARETISQIAQKATYDKVVQETVFGKLGSILFNKGRKIVPLGRVEIKNLELLGPPQALETKSQI